jgi:hypothetical protein
VKRARPFLLGLAVALASAPTWADDFELRPPETGLELELGPRERAARVRVYWACYERDLGAAARAWVGDRLHALDCASPDAERERDASALRAMLEAAAGGRVLGDPRKGDLRELDAAPGREKQVSANFCYSGTDVDLVVDWAARQLAARCAEAAPTEGE